MTTSTTTTMKPTEKRVTSYRANMEGHSVTLRVTVNRTNTTFICEAADKTNAVDCLMRAYPELNAEYCIGNYFQFSYTF